MQVLFFLTKTKYVKFSVEHVPRIGERVWLGDISYRVKDIVHHLAPHDINVQLRKERNNVKTTIQPSV